MRAAVVALACVLRLAASAQADEAARPPPAAPSSPPPALRPWVDPGSAQQIGDEQPSVSRPVTPAADETDPAKSHAARTDAAKSEASAPKETARPRQENEKPRQENASREGQSRGGQRLRQCLNAVETRQTVAARRLTEPFRALRAGRQQGEALRAKLCRWKQDQYVYEVFVLRRDGRIVRVYMNAQNGQAVGALEDR